MKMNKLIFSRLSTAYGFNEETGNGFVKLDGKELTFEVTYHKKLKDIVKVTGQVYNGVEIRQIPAKGQMSRFVALVDGINNQNTAQVLSIANSLANWEVEIIKCAVFVKTGDHRVEFIKTVDISRRSSFLQSGDIICYIADGKQTSNDEVIEVINSFGSFDYISEHIKFGNIREDMDVSFMLAAKEIRKRFGDKLNFLGGNPNAGLFLMSRCSLPSNNAQAQKLAKIKLSGGTTFSLLGLQAKLVDLSKMDGKVFIASDSTFREILELGVLPTNATSLQVRLYKNGVYAMKGTGSKAITESYRKALGKEDIVVDLDSYNKTFGKSKKVGDLVSLDELMVLSTDVELGVKEIHISGQMIDRIDPINQNGLKKLFLKKLNFLLNTWRIEPLETLPSFGMFKKIKNSGVALSGFGTVVKPEEEKNFDSLEDALEDILDGDVENELKSINYLKSQKDNILKEFQRIIKKGVTVEGASLRLEYEESLKTGECLIGKKASKVLKIKKGDEITVLRYPLLPSTSEGSSSMFSLKVVGFIEGNTLAMNAEQVILAMGDYDGDNVFVTTEIKSAVQAQINYTLSKLGVDPYLLGKYDESVAIGGFIKNASEVGILDSMFTTIYHFYDGSLPDAFIQFAGNAIQASIYKMKHHIDPKFSRVNFTSITQKFFPKAWEKVDSQYGPMLKLKSHPIVEFRKGKPTRASSLEELKKELGLILASLNPKVDWFYYEIIESIIDVIDDIPVIDTISPEELRAKAAKLYVNSYEFVTDGFSSLFEAVRGDLNKSFNMGIDQRNSYISNLSISVQNTVSKGTFKLLCAALLMDKRFKSLYAPYMFCSAEVLKEIATGNGAPVISKIMDAKVSITDTEIIFEKRKSTVQIWRPNAEGGNSVKISVGDKLFPQKDDKVAIGTIQYNLNRSKSTISVKPLECYVIVAADRLQKSGWILEVERAETQV